MYAQGELAADNRNAVARAVKDDTLLSVRSMSSYSGRAELVDLFYGQAYLLIEFMLETYGRDKMQALVTAFGEGLPQEAALQRAYGFGLNELNDLWRQSQGLEPKRSQIPWGLNQRRGEEAGRSLSRDGGSNAPASSPLPLGA